MGSEWLMCNISYKALFVCTKLVVSVFRGEGVVRGAFSLHVEPLNCSRKLGIPVSKDILNHENLWNNPKHQDKNLKFTVPHSFSLKVVQQGRERRKSWDWLWLFQLCSSIYPLSLLSLHKVNISGPSLQIKGRGKTGMGQGRNGISSASSRPPR